MTEIKNIADRTTAAHVCRRARLDRMLTLLLAVLCVLLQPLAAVAGETVHIGILLAYDTRLSTVEGFQEEMAEHTASTGATLRYVIRNAQGDRSLLAGLASELIAARPALAIAAGGIEADALKVASAGSGVPVIFLAVSSAVERGLIASMQAPGGNLTGIDTNDTALVEKRLWYLQKLLPQARRVLCFNVPDIAPSAASVVLARKFAAEVGIELQVVDVTSKEQVRDVAATIRRAQTDAILLLPVAITDAVLKEVLLPLSRREGIPIMGYNEESIENGAFAAYGGSRRACGAQAARIAIMVKHGVAPGVLPAETPSDLSLTINRRLVEELGLQLSERSWRLAARVVDLKL